VRWGKSKGEATMRLLVCGVAFLLLLLKRGLFIHFMSVVYFYSVVLYNEA